MKSQVDQVASYLVVALGLFNLTLRGDSDIATARAKLEEFQRQPSMLALEQAYSAARAIPEGAGAARREERLIALLEVLEQIHASKTPGFNPADDPLSYGITRTKFPDGQTGDEQYEAAIRRSEEKYKVFVYQRDLLVLQNTVVEQITKFVQRAYTKKERPRAEALIKARLTDAALKATIVDTIEP